ncbi:MAG: 16S rRNA (cytidine(1402)-2'-O)-methyltransferase [Verrucomicrobiota bacterium]|jgi:16S rRNA (cytidine1402-2'-O)-methyltransferase|nr:16S rRNA (cytidine(1402)-2'-O)-methyltransferase [Verrucomicrobiota bacterium]MDP7048381.1 16S rRNA (cytidine(1402)-2'-O)-methyltransferase [Verrucomicrobiota bacterium]
MPEPIDLPELTPAPLESRTLYLVATPIGNLEDITLRAIRTLRDCDLVAAEDTRHTGMLLKRLGLTKRQVSTHKFNEAKRSGEIVELLQGGGTVALVSDAGSPGISDPGQRVVAAVIEAGCRVESVPGACALVAALTASGLATDEFHFVGFLPVKSGQRAKRLAKLLELPGTIAVYESPHRVVKLLGELKELAPDRPVVLARELTKKFEQIRCGLPGELLAEYAERKPKGEFVVLIGQAG